jgi:hypothetical protein
MGCSGSSSVEFSALELFNQLCEKTCDMAVPDFLVEDFIANRLEKVKEIFEKMKSIDHILTMQLIFARDLIDAMRPSLKTPAIMKLFEKCFRLVEKKSKTKQTIRIKNTNDFFNENGTLNTVTKTSNTFSTNNSALEISPNSVSSSTPPTTPQSHYYSNCYQQRLFLQGKNRDRGLSIETDRNSFTPNSKLKSFYLCPNNNHSQETLGDFGFFDQDEEMI